jgi:hypothetical protein
MITFEIETLEGIIDYVLIDREDGSQLTMPKAVYDAQQVEHLTEIIPSE